MSSPPPPHPSTLVKSKRTAGEQESTGTLQNISASEEAEDRELSRSLIERISRTPDPLVDQATLEGITAIVAKAKRLADRPYSRSKPSLVQAAAKEVIWTLLNHRQEALTVINQCQDVLADIWHQYLPLLECVRGLLGPDAFVVYLLSLNPTLRTEAISLLKSPDVVQQPSITAERSQPNHNLTGPTDDQVNSSGQQQISSFKSLQARSIKLRENLSLQRSEEQQQSGVTPGQSRASSPTSVHSAQSRRSRRSCASITEADLDAYAEVIAFFKPLFRVGGTPKKRNLLNTQDLQGFTLPTALDIIGVRDILFNANSTEGLEHICGLLLAIDPDYNNSLKELFTREAHEYISLQISSALVQRKESEWKNEVVQLTEFLNYCKLTAPMLYNIVQHRIRALRVSATPTAPILASVTNPNLRPPPQQQYVFAQTQTASVPATQTPMPSDAGQQTSARQEEQNSFLAQLSAALRHGGSPHQNANQALIEAPSRHSSGDDQTVPPGEQTSARPGSQHSGEQTELMGPTGYANGQPITTQLAPEFGARNSSQCQQTPAKSHQVPPQPNNSFAGGPIMTPTALRNNMPANYSALFPPVQTPADSSAPTAIPGTAQIPVPTGAAAPQEVPTLPFNLQNLQGLSPYYGDQGIDRISIQTWLERFDIHAELSGINEGIRMRLVNCYLERRANEAYQRYVNPPGGNWSHLKTYLIKSLGVQHNLDTILREVMNNLEVDTDRPPSIHINQIIARMKQTPTYHTNLDQLVVIGVLKNYPEELQMHHDLLQKISAQFEGVTQSNLSTETTIKNADSSFNFVTLRLKKRKVPTMGSLIATTDALNFRRSYPATSKRTSVADKDSVEEITQRMAQLQPALYRERYHNAMQNVSGIRQELPVQHLQGVPVHIPPPSYPTGHQQGFPVPPEAIYSGGQPNIYNNQAYLAPPLSNGGMVTIGFPQQVAHHLEGSQHDTDQNTLKRQRDSPCKGGRNKSARSDHGRNNSQEEEGNTRTRVGFRSQSPSDPKLLDPTHQNRQRPQVHRQYTPRQAPDAQEYADPNRRTANSWKLPSRRGPHCEQDLEERRAHNIPDWYHGHVTLYDPNLFLHRQMDAGYAKYLQQTNRPRPQTTSQPNNQGNGSRQQTSSQKGNKSQSDRNRSQSGMAPGGQNLQPVRPHHRSNSGSDQDLNGYGPAQIMGIITRSYPTSLNPQRDNLSPVPHARISPMQRVGRSPYYYEGMRNRSTSAFGIPLNSPRARESSNQPRWSPYGYSLTTTRNIQAPRRPLFEPPRGQYRGLTPQELANRRMQRYPSPTTRLLERRYNSVYPSVRTSFSDRDSDEEDYAPDTNTIRDTSNVENGYSYSQACRQENRRRNDNVCSKMGRLIYQKVTSFMTAVLGDE